MKAKELVRTCAWADLPLLRGFRVLGEWYNNKSVAHPVLINCYHMQQSKWLLLPSGPGPP